jgi:hypothetical protein
MPLGKSSKISYTHSVAEEISRYYNGGTWRPMAEPQ